MAASGGGDVEELSLEEVMRRKPAEAPAVDAFVDDGRLIMPPAAFQLLD